jgi:hypothetical protein
VVCIPTPCENGFVSVQQIEARYRFLPALDLAPAMGDLETEPGEEPISKLDSSVPNHVPLCLAVLAR